MPSFLAGVLARGRAGVAFAAVVFALASASARAAEFRLEDYFAGTTYARGSFSAITGVRRDFEVLLTGRWNGKRLKLVEDFTYADGERDRKTWIFTRTGDDTYTGTREDVVGETVVTIVGDTARFSYDVYLDGEKRETKVRFHDKMVLADDGTVLNTALVTMFGLPVAGTRVEFRREPWPADAIAKK
jgi:hypothetical protein